jgi:3-isopropylmalate dehydrogenase
MVKSHWVLILPGDGIGPEIVDATLEVLETLQDLSGGFALIYEFPQVTAECLYMDAAAAALVNRPEHFQVIVTENMFGDILSDIGGATNGGLGMCPAANIGENLAYFEPIHGSAPDIAGRSLANPTSQLLAAAMMLKHLGELTAAALLSRAVWELYTRKRIKMTSTGAVEGGAGQVAREMKTLLQALAGDY